jgi:uncharacterized protein
MKRVILDSGPLVAWFCPRDEHYPWARRIFSELAPGSMVCEAVLAEVCHLVAKEGVTQATVVESIAAGRLNPVSLSNELLPIASLLKRYADAPMDFADACVVRISEIHPDSLVCTTDGHFKFFRKHQRENIALLAPFTS